MKEICIATTLKGTRCTKVVYKDNYCNQHHGKYINPVKVEYRKRKSKKKKDIFQERRALMFPKKDVDEKDVDGKDVDEKDVDEKDVDAKDVDEKDVDENTKNEDKKDNEDNEDNGVNEDNSANEDNSVDKDNKNKDVIEKLLKLTNNDINCMMNIQELKSLKDKIKKITKLDKEKYQKLDTCLRKRIKKLESLPSDEKFFYYKNLNCPITKKTRLCNNNTCERCYYRSFACHSKSKFWSKKNIKSPREVTICSGQKYIFDCDKCGHDFENVLKDITGGDWCGFCRSLRRCNIENCKTCFDSSFASVENSKYWSDKNIDPDTKLKINPRDISKSSRDEYLFNCPKCSHEYKMNPSDITHKSVQCPYCHRKRMCTFEQKCNICISRSLATLDICIYWNKEKNEKYPEEIYYGSDSEVYIDCPKCKHTFCTKANALKSGEGCTFCASRDLCLDESCTFCFNKSFASVENSKHMIKDPEKNRYWNPRLILKNSTIPIIFKCPDCKNEYKSKPNHITTGVWCGCTKNKTEAKFLKYLKENFELTIETQAKFNWCKNELPLPFDFFIPELRIIVEIDGLFHFQDLNHFKNIPFEERKRRDKYKMKCANEHGYSVIRIFQEDIWENKNNWEQQFLEAFCKYDQPTNKYIGSVYTEEFRI